MNWVLIGFGGAAGAIARYAFSGFVHRHYAGVFPFGTLGVNVIGCVLIGVGMVFVEERPLLSPEARQLLLIGFLGAFTTFSTFGYETVELLREGQTLPACLNIAANVALGIGGVILGRVVVRAIGL